MVRFKVRIPASLTCVVVFLGVYCRMMKLQYYLFISHQGRFRNLYLHIHGHREVHSIPYNMCQKWRTFSLLAGTGDRKFQIWTFFRNFSAGVSGSYPAWSLDVHVSLSHHNHHHASSWNYESWCFSLMISTGGSGKGKKTFREWTYCDVYS
jgi:hypothetical protein